MPDSGRLSLLVGIVVATACGGVDELDTSPGVTWALASHRANTISELRYNISLSVPASRDEQIRGHEIVSFTLSDRDHPVVLDFKDATERVVSVKVDGNDVSYETVNDHLIVHPDALLDGLNAIEIEFVAGDGSLNRRDDFLYTLFVPDRARFALPVFDQPNLKARYRLTLEVPADWRAVANGRRESHQLSGDRATIVFAETKPISTYLFSFAAGRFEEETGERDGRTFTMYHRETDDRTVARNREAIFDLHAAALAWLEEYTGLEYPFDKFDFVLIPAFQYGGMEHPGAILYRQSRLLLDESATQDEFLGRASVIAHETAHMWFGDLVTMDWFDDVWMKEVFANFMAAKIVHPSFPDVDHDLRFLLAHQPGAYDIDRTSGANPIRQPLENLQEAGTLYGPIIYQKAPVVMKQLELLMGEDAFRDGLREYLAEYQFGNATWLDLIDILDRRTPADLTSWSEVWVQEAGRPSVTVLVESRDEKISSLVVAQIDPLERGRVWRQRLNVLLGFHRRQPRFLSVEVDAQRVEVSDAVGMPIPDYVLPSGQGVGYGLFRLDSRTLTYLLEHLPQIADPLTRGVAWVSLWDAMLMGDVAPVRFVELAREALGGETDELNVERILDFLTTAYWRYLPDTVREALAPELEEQLWRLMRRAARRTLRSAYFAAFQQVALTESAVARLEGVWSGEETIPNLPLSENDMSALAAELAIRIPAKADEILEVQLGRIENPDRKARFAFVVPALSADSEERDLFFESLKDPRNREREPWVLAGVGYLHHPLRRESSLHYIRPSLELLGEIQRTGDIFFPQRWLGTTLNTHNSSAAAAVVRTFLAEDHGLSSRLMGKLLQSADPLFAAEQILDTAGNR